MVPWPVFYEARQTPTPWRYRNRSISGTPLSLFDLGVILSQESVVAIPASSLLVTLKRNLALFLREYSLEFHHLTVVFFLIVAGQHVLTADSTTSLRSYACQFTPHLVHSWPEHATNLLSSSSLKECQTAHLGFLKTNARFEILNPMLNLPIIEI